MSPTSFKTRRMALLSGLLAPRKLGSLRSPPSCPSFSLSLDSTRGFSLPGEWVADICRTSVLSINPSYTSYSHTQRIAPNKGRNQQIPISSRLLPIARACRTLVGKQHHVLVAPTIGVSMSQSTALRLAPQCSINVKYRQRTATFCIFMSTLL